MKTLILKVCVFSAALILVVLLSGARGLPTLVHNECERNTSWSIWSVLDDRQTRDTVNGKTTETQDISSRSEQHSSNGEESTDLQTHHTNADGSSHGHEELTYTDSEGKGCHNSDGIPVKWRHRQYDDTDTKGNRKRHSEEIIEKNGKCVKSTRDWEWDSQGKLIKDTGWIDTDVLCGKYNLEISYKGFMDLNHTTITWGPNTAVIYLEPKGEDTYEGKTEEVFDAKATGMCEGTGTFPVSYDVTATKEDEFGEMDFSVNGSRSRSAVGTCLGQSGSYTAPTITKTYTFKLPAEDGASKTFSEASITLTFTLKKR